ncbi:hypothetical protein PVL29_026735 [Vitis rotundifolia]|uniref:BHLH domain-containing protein n=2 Tax=Vitis rotundifolia TaxID=103349 RepID=A0AA38YH63_VITRO|nr:hypothetical protein PVL29_026735 [Vitis rotundifolia]
MDVSSAKWLTELGIEDPTFIHQYQMQSFGNPVDHGFNFQSVSSDSYSSYLSFSSQTTPNFCSSAVENFQTDIERTAKQLKTNSWESSTSNHITPKASSSSSSQLLSFGNSNSPLPTDVQNFHENLDCTMKPKDEAASHGNMNFASVISQRSYENQNHGHGTKRVGTPMTRNPSNNQDHVIAERKRREKLTQRFIALSAIVPGLKKTDKASVLGDAIKYLKQLQERVKTLEEQTTKKTVESVVSVKKSKLSDNDQNPDSFSDQPLPEIEARVSNKDVLIRIHCVKQKGFAVRILSEIEKLRLRVVNSSVLPFGDYIMDITVVAQMEDEFCTTAKDLVRNLRLAFQHFM